MAPQLHETLWNLSRDIAEACRDHSFVRGLADGGLDPDVFRRYVAQDAFFLGAFARAYALAAARCVRQEDLEDFCKFLGGALEEKRLHQKYAGELGVSLVGIEPNPATLAYTDFLLKTAWKDGLGNLLAAMTPCMKLYAYLGQDLARGGVPDHRYRNWIETYSSAEFADLTKSIETVLDRNAEDCRSVQENYRYAMSCELDFFSAVFETS